MSAATLACKGLFKDTGKRPDRRFLDLLAQFKAFARALRAAVEDDPRVQGVPSTKGAL